MNYLLNPSSSYGFVPSFSGDGDIIGTWLTRYSPYVNPLYAHVPLFLATLLTANLANLPVLVNSSADGEYCQLSLKVNDDELLVVRYYSESHHHLSQVLARYPRRPAVGSDATNAQRLVDDYCRVLTTHETAPITFFPTDSGHEELTVGFVPAPIRDFSQNHIRLRLGAYDLDDVFTTSNINEILFCDTKARSTSVSLENALLATCMVWRSAQSQNSILSAHPSTHDVGLWAAFTWPEPGVASVALHSVFSYWLDGSATVVVDNNAFAKFILEGARRVDKVSASVCSYESALGLTPVLDAISSQTAHLDNKALTFHNNTIGSITALSDAISAVDFDQTPTMGLANLIQSQNRVTQALVLALLRKSSSRAWFTSLIDKIGDANALLIDDEDIAAIAEKAYQANAVSNDEIHATPREAYKQLFNDKGVNHG